MSVHLVNGVDPVLRDRVAADLDHLNLAAKLRDGEQVLVTTTSTAPPATG